MNQPSSSTEPPAGRIQELDALRGLAALGVLTLHYTWDYDRVFGHSNTLMFYNPVGKYGVELFFMLSGFVMLMTMRRTRRVADFAVARFTRLYPAYWCGIVLTFVIVTVAQLPGSTVSLGEAISNLTMLQTQSRDVDPVYWTLQCELQFYIVMALLLGFQLTRHVPVILSALVAVHIADGFWAFSDWNGWGLWRLNNWLPMQHFYLFLTGVVLFDMRSGFRLRHAAMLSLAVFEAMRVSFEHTWITFLLATLLYVVTRHRAKFLTGRPLLFLGSISYPLYLVHQNIGYVVIRVAQQSGLESHLSILLATTVVIGLACLVTIYIDQPARRWIIGRYRALTSTPPQDAPATAIRPRFA